MPTPKKGDPGRGHPDAVAFHDVWDLFDHWQTVIAGVLALVAAFGTVVATMIIARKQIAASREDADSMIAATRAQTDATFKQTETTLRLEQSAMPAKPSHFTPCSKRRWRASSPRRLGPEKPIRRF